MFIPFLQLEIFEPSMQKGTSTQMEDLEYRKCLNCLFVKTCSLGYLFYKKDAKVCGQYINHRNHHKMSDKDF